MDAQINPLSTTSATASGAAHTRPAVAVPYATETVMFQSYAEKYMSGYQAPAAQYPQVKIDDGGLGFGDVFDIINPFQHIPVISYFYRQATGDEIKGFARIAGGGLFGGPIGAASAAANTLIEAQTGQDVAEHVLGYSENHRPATTNYQEVTAKYAHNAAGRYND